MNENIEVLRNNLEMLIMESCHVKPITGQAYCYASVMQPLILY